jgi:hypothetical protein
MISLDDLLDWANRAERELQAYAQAAEDAGCEEPETLALIDELNDIRAERPQWQKRHIEAPACKTLLDEL